MDDEFKSELGNRIKDLRELDERTLEEVADAADIHRTTLGKIERGEREPSLSNAMGIADALNITITELTNPESFRTANRDYLIEEADVYKEVPIDGSAILNGVEEIYENLDTIDFALSRRGLDPLAEQFDEYAALSTVIGEFFASGVSGASDGLYDVNAGNFPDLISSGKQSGVPGIEVKMAMEDNSPKGHIAKPGMYVVVRYILGGRDKSYDPDERKDTPWIWEVRMGEMEEEQFNESDTEGDSGKTATFTADALWDFDVLYLDPDLIPYTDRYYKKKDEDALMAVTGQEQLS